MAFTTQNSGNERAGGVGQACTPGGEAAALSCGAAKKDSRECDGLLNLGIRVNQRFIQLLCASGDLFFDWNWIVLSDVDLDL